MRYRILASILAFGLVAAACGGDTSVFDLKVGDCFDDQDLTQIEVATVPTVDCPDLHDNEIYFEYSMNDAAFPGDNATLESAALRCLDEFAGFVGAAYLDSELDLFPITPTAESWADGDRVVYCALYAVDLSKLTNSMRGTRR